MKIEHWFVLGSRKGWERIPRLKFSGLFDLGSTPTACLSSSLQTLSTWKKSWKPAGSRLVKTSSIALQDNLSNNCRLLQPVEDILSTALTNVLYIIWVGNEKVCSLHWSFKQRLRYRRIQHGRLQLQMLSLIWRRRALVTFKQMLQMLTACSSSWLTGNLSKSTGWLKKSKLLYCDRYFNG